MLLSLILLFTHCSLSASQLARVTKLAPNIEHVVVSPSCRFVAYTKYRPVGIDTSEGRPLVVLDANGAKRFETTGVDEFHWAPEADVLWYRKQDCIPTRRDIDRRKSLAVGEVKDCDGSPLACLDMVALSASSVAFIQTNVRALDEQSLCRAESSHKPALRCVPLKAPFPRLFAGHGGLLLIHAGRVQNATNDEPIQIWDAATLKVVSTIVLSAPLEIAATTLLPRGDAALIVERDSGSGALTFWKFSDTSLRRLTSEGSCTPEAESTGPIDHRVLGFLPGSSLGILFVDIDGAVGIAAPDEREEHVRCKDLRELAR